MKLRLYLLLGFLFTALLQMSCLAQEKELVVKELQADEAHTWDFGQVQKGEVLKHSFTLKNETKMVLHIFDVDTTCGCTASKVKKDLLAPGAETLLEVEFDTKGYSGPVAQFIYVHTNRILEPVINFKIKADVTKKKK